MRVGRSFCAVQRCSDNLSVNARKEKLRAMCEAQCASLRSRLERRVNRVPATKRQMPLIELLAPPPPPVAKPVPAPAKTAPAKKAPTKKAAPAPAPVPALAPPPKARAAPASTASSRSATVKAAPAPKPTTKPRHAPSKSVPTTSLRGKKRSSDEATEDKENVSIELAVPKKRVRAATTVAKQATVSKPAAPAVRSTRAASRKTAPADVLSPKNNNVRAKPSLRSVRTK